jgi:L-methionine (R)-S-oxide reductase
MSEELIINKGSREEQYLELIPQIAALLEGESDQVANMANITAALKQQFNWLWIGFYLVKGEDLVLGPFQGPIACTRIKKGRGVCGTAWEQQKTIIVPDVEAFSGHIACSSLSKSEIVLPLFHLGEVTGVLDVDHSEYSAFDKTDELFLTEVLHLLRS